MAENLPSWDTHDAQILREFAKVRLIAADLDGTLLQSNTYQIYDNIRQLEINLRRYYKVSMTIATGRTLAGAANLLEKLSLPKAMPIVLYNGGLLLESGTKKILLRKTISSRSLINIVRLLENYRVRILAYFYSDTNWFSTEESKEIVLGWTKIDKFSKEYNGMPVLWQSKNEIDHSKLEPCAILIDVSEEFTRRNSIEKIVAAFDDITSTSSGGKYIEIRPKNSNKAIALKSAITHLGLSRHDILTLGDNDNDSEMLAWAGIGVAISHSSASALKNCRYVCSHGVAEGAIEVLRLVKNARRYFPD